MDTLEKIPWYRTRWFWGVIAGIVALLSILFFQMLAGDSGNLSSNQILTFIFFSTGASLFYIVGNVFFGEIGRWVGGGAYYILLAFLLFKTFKHNRVNTIYPLICLGLFAAGMSVSLLYFSSGL